MPLLGSASLKSLWQSWHCLFMACHGLAFGPECHCQMKHVIAKYRPASIHSLMSCHGVGHVMCHAGIHGMVRLCHVIGLGDPMG